MSDKLKVLIIQETDAWGTKASCSNIVKWIDKNRFQADRLARTQIHAVMPDTQYDVVHIYCSWHDEKGKRFYPVRYPKEFRSLFPDSDTKISLGVRGTLGWEMVKKDNRIDHFDAVNVSNKTLYKIVKEEYDNVYLCEAGVDTSLFHLQPQRKIKKFLGVSETYPTGKDVIIGTAANINNPIKNGHLLHRFGYKSKIAVRQRFLDTSLKPEVKSPRYHYDHREMPKYYGGLDIYVLLSEHEGCNLGVMEAAGSGLPIVSTNIGQVSELLDSEWIVDGSIRAPHNFKIFKSKLDILAVDPELRNQVGTRNNSVANSRWSWNKVIIEQWENFFEAVASG